MRWFREFPDKTLRATNLLSLRAPARTIFSTSFRALSRMPPPRILPQNRRTIKSDLPLAISLSLVVIFFVASGVVSFRNARFLMDDVLRVAHTHEVITALDSVGALMKDAESGQRGYVITGDVRYLEPYTRAQSGIADHITKAETLVQDNSEQLSQFPPLRAHVAAKFSEMEETISLRRTIGYEAARDLVGTDRGKIEMDALRARITEMRDVERGLRRQRVASMQQAYRTTVTSGIVTAALGILLSLFVAILLRRAAGARREQEWLQAGKVGLAAAIVGEQHMDQLCENLLGFLVKYFDAHAAAVFTRAGEEFRRVATYGVPEGSTTPLRFGPGDGLLGEAVTRKELIMIHDVPDGYLTIGSGFGRGNPRHLIIAPAVTDSTANAVIEMGFIHPLDKLSLTLLVEVADQIGVAVKSAIYRENLQELLEETQRQSEELQAQSEELRVSNEELEEQSRAIKESQTRLELQQAELEQTNSQLEEQTQMLEAQRNDLVQAQVTVQAKADELERSSRYKSDFLANMSHELRTPLNSLLILSKLLSDNTDDNLTAEQVNYARTIQSSGNDLLVLINDILDLSKIEAGHMEIHPEPMPLSRLAGDLARVFDPLAKQKGLLLTTHLDGTCPEVMETDRQRLEQILRNLLSNALKFTEKGRVDLAVSKNVEGRMVFAVRDTGIGISEEHQRAVFEAFHQADGTISRRYGGTGLGLSISRELARLLGGAISLESTPGQGSTFTLVLPETFQGQSSPAAPKREIFAPLPQTPANVEPASAVERTRYVPDDREALVSGKRTILVVEDEEFFARALHDMVHELGFQCLVSTSAEDALLTARQYLPNAVLLDVGLPDNSGLTVLDRLKQDIRTRHIPIHVISAGDHSRTAYSLGAVGYLLKPVKREEILDALKQLDARLAEGMRHVLIVEDDEVQRGSLAKLLGSHDVETVAVGTASECLEKLKTTTFDCMVLDLTLPDASGYSLLETLSREHAYSFPPVIVYTGRDLSHEEEQKLRRYSKSIIIKGAKSPERLLDEVTLFLHQVVAELPPEQQKMLKKAHNRDAVLEGRHILIVEDDVRNIYSLTNILEPRGAKLQIARNGREALAALEKTKSDSGTKIDLVLMDVMMPEMDGMTATREIRKEAAWKKLPIIMLTAKAMKNDQERCLEAGANDYMAKPLDVEKLLSLIRVWMPR